MSRILHVSCTSAIGTFLCYDVHGSEALFGTTGIPVISVFLSQVNDSEDSKGLLSGSKRIKRTADHREQGSPYYEFKMPVETIHTLHLSRTPFFLTHAIVRVRKYRKYITVQRLGRRST